MIDMEGFFDEGDVVQFIEPENDLYKNVLGVVISTYSWGVDVEVRIAREKSIKLSATNKELKFIGKVDE